MFEKPNYRDPYKRGKQETDFASNRAFAKHFYYYASMVEGRNPVKTLNNEMAGYYTLLRVLRNLEKWQVENQDKFVRYAAALNTSLPEVRKLVVGAAVRVMQAKKLEASRIARKEQLSVETTASKKERDTTALSRESLHRVKTASRRR